MEGWIKLHRKMLEWEWFNDNVVLKVFIYLLLSANHKEKKWRGIVIPAGSLIIGRKSLAATLNLSESQIRTALNKLKSTNEIAIKTTNKYSLISIVNWDKYQQSDQQNDQQMTNKRPTNDQQMTTNKNDKNDKNDKNGKNNNSGKNKELYFFREEEEKLPGNLTKETWQQYVNERIAMKKPLTLKAAKMALDKLRKYENTHDIEEVVQDSIISGWQGLFPNDKHLLDKSKKVTRLKTFAEIEEERQQEKMRQLEERLRKKGLI